MLSSDDLISLFFHDLKEYNNTNFKTLKSANLIDDNISSASYKSFSSVITRFFIFAEHHPEISDLDLKVLYFKLSLDKIARYFSEYPRSSKDDLIPFQNELKRYCSNLEVVEEDD